MAKKGVHLRIYKEVREELLAAAKDELRHPNVMLNVLLAWALKQRDLLSFDLSKLVKVHLSLVQEAADKEPWNNVVSGLLEEDAAGNLTRMIVR